MLNNYTTINKLNHSNKIIKIMWITLPSLFTFIGALTSFDNIIAWGIFTTELTSIFLSGPFALFKNILKCATKNNNGYKLELEELEKKLIKSKEFLKQLKNNKSKENEKEAMNKKTENINGIHLDEYRKIRNELLFYREIGENEKDLLKYFNAGTLEENLDETYELDEIEKIKVYFKNKK